MLILEVAKKKFMNLFVCFILEFSICFVILQFWVWVPKSMLKKLHCQCNYMCRSFYFPGSMYTYANCTYMYIIDMCISFYFPGSMYTYANCMHIYIYTNTDMCILVKKCAYIYLCIPITYTHIIYMYDFPISCCIIFFLNIYDILLFYMYVMTQKTKTLRTND